MRYTDEVENINIIGACCLVHVANIPGLCITLLLKSVLKNLIIGQFNIGYLHFPSVKKISSTAMSLLKDMPLFAFSSI